MRNIPIVLSGPSGVGKGTLVELLLQEDHSLTKSVSCTTRSPRAGEKSGDAYFFITREEFENRVRENDFLEYDEHFGNLYGTPRSFVERQLKEKSVLLEIDVVGGLNAKRLMPQTILVMVVPPSIEALYERLGARGSETEEEKQTRLQRVKYELEQRDLYDYVVVNDDLERAKRELQNIINQEKNREVI